MNRISVERCEPGMVLAEPVTDRRGRLLVSAGGELSARIISSLRMWGVDQVVVEGGGEEGRDSEVDEETLVAAREVVDAIFVVHDADHPFIRALHDAAVIHRARRMVS